ncbi:hypothetical protein ACHAXT_012215 [Thalassiosira profunda]
MLSGIKTGKKRNRPPAPAAAPPPSSVAAGGGAGLGRSGGGGDGNRSAAEALRASLLGGGSAAVAATSTSGKQSDRSDVQSRLNDRLSSYKSNESAINNLQSRGRISGEAVAAPKDDSIVVNTAGKSTIQYENEQGVRYNSRGKLSRHAHDQLRQKNEQEMTIEQMAAAERSNNSSNMDEMYARNVLKMGKGYKKLDKIMGSSRSGADEDDYQQSAELSNLYRSNEDKLSPAELAARSQSRQIAKHDAISKWTAKSWWWMESPKFDKRYLIALGEKTSLVLTPTHKRLEQDVKKGMWGGGQCYIVPLSYSESFVGLDEEVWYEVRRFQSSLRRMFQSEGRGVLFIETVTRTSRGGGGTALQAKMEVIPVPRSVERDAPLYFKSALAEVAQEWGTHGNKPITLNETKTLRTAVPKGFPYFYCGWEGPSGGYVQLIENEDDGDDDEGGAGGMRAGGGSKRFPRDFGIDTIGGMMGCDPMRFQRKSPAPDGDRSAILQFCEKFKAFDWTLELDS